MKKILLLFFLLAGFSGMAFAHPDGHPRPDEKKLKELREYKIKYLAQEMELRDDQKAKFIEVYDKMSDEKRKNFESMKAMERKLRKDASEEEYRELSNKISDCKLRDAQIEKEYDAKFAEFLTPKQIYKMKEAEEKFHKKMMEMHHKRRHEKKK